MVKENNIKGMKVYICERCDMAYKTREMAEKCEEFCGKYNSCSLDITKHAIKL